MHQNDVKLIINIHIHQVVLLNPQRTIQNKEKYALVFPFFGPLRTYPDIF